jgi:hypothetical protein
MDKDRIEQRWDGTMGQTAISCTDRKRPGSLPELRLTVSDELAAAVAIGALAVVSDVLQRFPGYPRHATFGDCCSTPSPSRRKSSGIAGGRRSSRAGLRSLKKWPESWVPTCSDQHTKRSQTAASIWPSSVRTLKSSKPFSPSAEFGFTLASPN